MPAFPDIRVGDPVRHLGLAAFPLFSDAPPAPDYLLSDEAIAAGSVTVEEVSEAGSVPDLLVRNAAGVPVLFLEGEELRGAKQNRVLNATLLASAAATLKVPVSCVEQGRWHMRSRAFGSSGSHCSSKMRHVLKRTVGESTKSGRGHSSDQTAVWHEVSRQMSSLGSGSATMAMADTYDSYRPRLDEFRGQVPYAEGARGLAVAVGGKVVSIDLFDKPATCQKVWGRLLTGLVMDALESGQPEGAAGPDDVRSQLSALVSAAWQQTPAVGAGDEFRAEPGDGRHASALAFGGAVVHASLIAPW
jgi:hypothetical protein